MISFLTIGQFQPKFDLTPFIQRKNILRCIYPFICIKLIKRNSEIIHALYIVLIFIFIYKKIYQVVPAFSYK